MNRLSFVTANFVARQLDYQMGNDWSEGDQATQQFFRPVATFADRMDQLLLEVKQLGFGGLDLWLAHLHPDWATEAHVRALQELLSRHQLQLTSLAGGAQRWRTLERLCWLAQQLDVDVIAGMTPLLAEDRARFLTLLEQHQLRWAWENHPEKSPAQVLQQIGSHRQLGLAIDTGWWLTQGYPPEQAIREGGERIWALHLKDVRTVGRHDTCALGDGLLDLKACLAAVREVGYRGSLTVEHEPHDHDPRPEIQRSRERVEQLWPQLVGAGGD